jgi:hypothetical protein
MVQKIEEFRININIIVQQAANIIEYVPPKNLTEYTNLLNVIRINDLENFVTTGLRAGMVRSIVSMFTSEKHREGVKEMTLEQVAKVLSDLVHHTTFVTPIGNRMAALLTRQTATQEVSKEDERRGLKDLTSVVRVLDKVANVDGANELLENLLRRLDRYLREPKNFDQLSVPQKARLLLAFARANHELIIGFPIQEKLVRSLLENLEMVEENEVNYILRAYQYLENDVKNSNRLLSTLNETVVQSAMQNKDAVNTSFLINYLHYIFLISQGISRN